MKKQKATKTRTTKAPAKMVRATKTQAVTSRDDAKLGLSERLKAQHRLGAKGKPGGKPVTVVDSRDEIDRDSGRMTRRDQFFDHQNDHTEETVTFQDTGEAKFKKSGRLSEKNQPKQQDDPPAVASNAPGDAMISL